MGPSNPWTETARLAWRTRWRRWRNRLLSSPKFQYWAARLPGSNRIARRRARELFDLVAGFTYSQILLAVIESGLLDHIADGPVATEALAKGMDLSEEATVRLVRAAAALELVDDIGDDRWMLSGRGAVLRANHGVQAMIRHHKLLYSDLADPLALLRADRKRPTALSRFWQYGASAGSDTANAYSSLMAMSQQMVADELLATYPFGRHRAVLDIGGGHGAFLREAARQHPSLRLGLFDLPDVVRGAKEALADTDLDARTTFHEGSFFRDALPAGYDCLTLIRILHDHDDDRALAILRAARAAMSDGARLVIAEPMAGTGAAPAMGDAYFGLYLWAMNSGRPRTAREIGAMLDTAGFASWHEAKTAQPLIARVIVAST